MPDQTLTQLLTEAIKSHGDRPAVHHRGDWLNYSDLDRLSEKLAGALTKRGIVEGVRVALLLANTAAYVIADLTLLKLGATKIPLHGALSPDEIAHCVSHSGALLLLHDESDIPPQSDAASFGISIETIEAMVSQVLPTPRRIDPGTLALIIYTGGTTGLPKGVCHSQAALAINLLAHVTCGDIRSDEVMLLSTPLPHSAGFHMQTCLLQGGRVILRERFDAKELISDCDEFGVTWTFMVPTMLYRFLDTTAPEWRPQALRTLLYGAAPVRWSRVEEAVNRFGPVLLQLYGQSEAPNWLTRLSKEDHLDPSLAGACGRPVPFARIRLGDVTDGIGEIEVQCPYMLGGYLDNPEATSAALLGGWLRTGDIARMDDRGYLFLLDRKKDIVISGGLNVYCAEVEQAIIHAGGGVTEAAVFGVPDSDWGERVVAHVVAQGSVSAEEIRAALKKRLSSYKVPKTIVVVPDLPRTPYGKTDKKQLRADYVVDA